LFNRHGKAEVGKVVPFAELSYHANEWGPRYAEGLEAAMKELRDEGYAIITVPHGLELTERGFSYLYG
jgi:hypothetical protein